MINSYEKATVFACQGWSWGCLAHTTTKPEATLTAAVIAVFCFAWWWIKKFTNINPPLPPGPRGFPILGSIPFIKPDLHRYFVELSEFYGPIFKLQLGTKACIVINSPSIAKEVLKDHDAIFANRDTPAATIVGMYGGVDIVWRPNGPDFIRLRKLLLHQVMSKSRLDASCELRRREVRQMMKDVHGKIGSPVNLGEQVALTTVKVMITTLWGGSSERSSDLIEFKKRIDEFIRLMGTPNVSDFLPVLAPFDLQGIQSKSKKLLSWFYGIFESMIMNRLKTEDAGKNISKDFLQQLLELNQTGDDGNISLSNDEVKALLLDMMIGGTDTISTTVEWAMTELLRHPDKMAKLVEELDTVAGNQNLAEESLLPQLLYLNAVVKETLRLHPVVPLLLPHMPSQTSIIAGYTIPKHSRVFVNAWAMQRNPQLWDDPLGFQPERFLEADISYKGNDLRYIPFGSGRRICGGIAMAERMVGLLLAALVHSFEWKLPEGRKPDIEEEFGVVLKKTESLVAIPFARLSNLEQYK
ncbi:cytochrome P450, family 706, subfamily A, polypeptide 6 [Hibiscus trionum]|uniref:Cytochrome P450, family 706, subfamily A, polypeptide 6 n=1 Tax=Hibiscus trionum TaxID=183268 RepID=A0A9W7JA89_HIBTR|nr:cytochrome P450, family 706, subfamily A, polypeptide 6 [Hibiscus trionum]